MDCANSYVVSFPDAFLDPGAEFLSGFPGKRQCQYFIRTNFFIFYQVSNTLNHYTGLPGSGPGKDERFFAFGVYCGPLL
jgi:hypothetical protein